MLLLLVTFVSLRKMALSNAELRLEVETIKKKVDNQNRNIGVIFRYFDELLEHKDKPRKNIGYQISDKGK